VRVTVCGELALPTPVAEKLRDPGCTCIEPAAPPIPESVAVAAMANDEELTVSAPAMTPLDVGVKTTPVEQLPPAARMEPQVS
jgi:hypothetical protein